MSCLFDSLSTFVPNMNAAGMRNLICDFLGRNEKLTDDLFATDVVKFESEVGLDEYVANMRQSYTMGGATEIKVFCIIFNKNVRVLSVPNRKTIDFIYNENLPSVTIRWTGGHYDPVHN